MPEASSYIQSTANWLRMAARKALESIRMFQRLSCFEIPDFFTNHKDRISCGYWVQSIWSCSYKTTTTNVLCDGKQTTASSSCKQAQRISTGKQYTSKGVTVCRYRLDRVVRINVLWSFELNKVPKTQ